LYPQSAPSKKQERFLKRRSEFLNTYKGKFFKTKLFTLYFIDNKYGYLRFGTTIPAKVANSVVRNRIKRWCKEIYRSHFDKSGSLDIHCLVRKPKSPEMKNLLKNEFESLLRESLRSLMKK
jgi:ribonuclease P protein component